MPRMVPSLVSVDAVQWLSQTPNVQPRRRQVGFSVGRSRRRAPEVPKRTFGNESNKDALDLIKFLTDKGVTCKLHVHPADDSTWSSTLELHFPGTSAPLNVVTKLMTLKADEVDIAGKLMYLWWD